MADSKQTTGKNIFYDSELEYYADICPPLLVDVNSLTTPQLAEVQQQLQQEIDHLTGSFQKLQQAQLKFNECGETVKVTSRPENEGVYPFIYLQFSRFWQAI